MAKLNTSEKIKDFDELVKLCRAFKKKKKTIALCHGVFDLLHPGHIRHFEAAKKKADILVVTITKDKYVNKGPGRPVFNHRLRAESVAALAAVDFVAINQWPVAVETIQRLKPSYYVKGSDYKKKEDDLTGKIFDEQKAIESVGGKVLFTDDITFSSSQILNRYFSIYPKETDEFLKKFKRKYNADFIIDSLKQTSKLKVLVVGDAIIDEYHYCVGIGKPQKADIIATKYLNEERFTGGSLAVAKHVANFCKEVHLVTALGKEKEYQDFVANNLPDNIKTKIFIRKSQPTVVKRRYLNPSFLNKTFEIAFIDDTPLSKPLSAKVCSYLNKVASKYDVVISADFGHGFIDENIVKLLSKRAKFLAVNTQTNSANLGYNLITKYSRADYICIDEPEVRLAMHDKFGKIEDLILALKKKLKCKKIVITRGHNGATTYEEKKGFSHIPVFSKEIVDRVGAGDAFLSVTSPVVKMGFPLELVGFIGNAVGALAVLIVGNRNPVDPVKLFKFITTLLK